jgi:hypothetical protein
MGDYGKRRSGRTGDRHQATGQWLTAADDARQADAVRLGPERVLVLGERAGCGERETGRGRGVTAEACALVFLVASAPAFVAAMLGCAL